MSATSNPQPRVVRAGVYTRISSDPSGQRAGVECQRADCATHCLARGWTVAEVFCDNDASAYSRKPRDAYERMLAAVEAGRIDAIVTWHNDRLHRSPKELEAFIDLVERLRRPPGGRHRRRLRPDDGGRSASARIVGAVARKESEDAAGVSAASSSSWRSRGSRRASSDGGCGATKSVNSCGRPRNGCSPAMA